MVLEKGDSVVVCINVMVKLMDASHYIIAQKTPKIFLLSIPYFLGYYFWLNSSDATRVFRMQKKELRLVTKSTFNECCRENFKTLKSLPFPSLYIYKCLFLVHLYLKFKRLL